MALADPIKIGFIGAGRIARVHARTLQTLEGAQPLAWSAQHASNAAAAAREFGGVAMATEGLLAHKEIEAIIISTPTHLHASQVIQAFESEKHVFCEKPIARTEAQANEMIAASQKISRTLFVGHTLRFFSIYAKARELLLAGEIGTLRRATCRRLNRPQAGWLLDYDKSGGCILDLLIHDFDFLNWCLGTPTRVEVETVPDKDTSGVRHAIVHLYFATGAKAEVEGSWLHDHFEHSFLWEGDEGRLKFEADGLLRLENKRGAHVIETPSDDPYRMQMKNFLQHLHTGSPLLATPEDARAALAVALAGLKKLEMKAKTSP